MKTPSIQLPAEVAAARQKLKDACAERSKIASALQRAHADLQEAEGNYAGAEASLAASETDRALGKPSSADGARKSFVASRDSLEFVRARIRGLESTLVITTDSVETARRQLSESWAKFVGTFEAGLNDDYDAALAQFLAVVDRGMALANALGMGRQILALRKVVLPGSSDGSKKLISAPILRDQWKRDPILVEMNQALVELKREVLDDLAEVPANSVAASTDPRDSGSSDTAVPIFSRGGLRL